jgi:hypothetical protein
MKYRIVYQFGPEETHTEINCDPLELILNDPNIIQIYVYDEFGIQIEFFEQL